LKSSAREGIDDACASMRVRDGRRGESCLGDG
jgi:hypothetical protein